MKKILLLCTSFLLFNCVKKEILLPQFEQTFSKEVTDFTETSFLYEESKDGVTEIDVQKNALVSNTAWLFSIDKRLPLKLVVPELQTLQEKKLKKVEDVLKPNFFVYSNPIQEAVEYCEFTKVSFEKKTVEMASNAVGVQLQFNRDNQFKVNGLTFDEFPNYLDQSGLELAAFLKQKFPNQKIELFLSFDENLNFGDYVKDYMCLKKIEDSTIKVSNLQVIY